MTTPLAPSLAASRLRRCTAASVWPWVPKPAALVDSSWAISTEPTGALEYTRTCAGSIGARAWPSITLELLAQPASKVAMATFLISDCLCMVDPGVMKAG